MRVPTPLTSYSPLVLDVPGRAVPLEVKVSAPETGDDLPVILFSHGHGMTRFLASLHGYGPLVDFWGARGFVVIQPTHLDSGMLGLREADDPDAPLYTRSRALDMHAIVDRLVEIDATVPGLAGRVDHDRIVVAGHSLGGLTASMLLGARAGTDEDLSDPRIAAGVVLGGPGSGEDLAPWASERYPVLRHTDFSPMTGRALVVAGDKDLNPRFSERLSYRSDPYTRSPGPKELLTLFGAEHMFGGISGYDAAETTDEDPERVATLRALAWAYFRSVLDPRDPAWDDAVAALERAATPVGTVDSKARPRPR